MKTSVASSYYELVFGVEPRGFPDMKSLFYNKEKDYDVSVRRYKGVQAILREKIRTIQIIFQLNS